MAKENLFAGAYLDRRAEARLREDWLLDARADRGTLYIGMRQGAALVHPGGADRLARLAFLPVDDPRIAAAGDPEQLVLLGWYEERRCVLVELPEDFATTQEVEAFAELRPLSSELPAREAALAAYARAMNLWRANHRFCGRCGTPTVSERAGHARRCPACGYQSFPRLDPAIIVLAQDGERALLGRQPGWPPGRYSTIAGFVEPGESLEDAVRRELLEEAGVEAVELQYDSSQPWPFPSSLMLGFMARAIATPPVLNDGELEDAQWFSRDDVLSGRVLLPPRESISRRLIENWLYER
jgi:NAD+ diphosphatase